MGVLAATLMAAAVSAASATGTIQGHVRLTGPAPGNPIIRMGMDPMCAQLNAGPSRPAQSTRRAPRLRATCGGEARVTAWAGVVPHPYLTDKDDADGLMGAEVRPGHHQIGA